MFIKRKLGELGWNTRNPERNPSGQVYTQNECLSNRHIKKQLKLDRPENIVKVTEKQLWVIEAKRSHGQIEQAVAEAQLVSCGAINHGFVGRFNIPPEKQYRDTITVAYNGLPLTAKFRPYEFGTKDDIGVLIPHQPLSELALVYIAALLNSMRWRFSYGRKCFRTKLRGLEIDVPAVRHKGLIQIDESNIGAVVGMRGLDMRPKLVKKRRTNTVSSLINWEMKCLNDIFELRRGDFHSLKTLGKGSCATVSRTENDNGVVGYFEQPEGSIKYDSGLITVSTVSGDAFVQVENFIVTDNVIVCVPLRNMRITTAYFIASMINHQKWRYGYGRQCYKEKLSALTIQVPWRNGGVDETAIEKIVKRQPYWLYVKDQLGH